MARWYMVKVYSNRVDAKNRTSIGLIATSKLYKTKRGAEKWASKNFNEIYPSNEDVTAILEEIVWYRGETHSFEISYYHA